MEKVSFSFQEWITQNNLPSTTIDYIEKIRNSNPVRNVSGRRSNVSGRYPSENMMSTIQYESRTIEQCAVLAMEYDDDVCEFYDQPAQIKLIYRSASGKNIGVLHVPDFLVIRVTSVGFEEWKDEKEMLQLAEKSPHRYQQDENGNWRCPPGEDFAAEMGLYYRLRTSKEINYKYQKNIVFLENFTRQHSQMSLTDEMEVVYEFLRFHPLSSLEDLLISRSLPEDIIYLLVIKGLIDIDLESIDIRIADRIALRVNGDRIVGSLRENDLVTHQALMELMKPGGKYCISGVIYKFVGLDKKGYQFTEINTEKSHIFEITQLADAYSSNQLKEIICQNSEVEQYLEYKIRMASTEDWRLANKRNRMLLQWMNEKTYDSSEISERTLRRWAKAYQESSKMYGNGFFGLLPSPKFKGNYVSRISDEVQELMDYVISEKYETSTQINKKTAYLELQTRCEEKSLIPPCEKTFRKRINQRDEYQSILKRKGKRAAYQIKPFYRNLEYSLPVHGFMPFQIVHIDHTQCDIELISSTDANSGRPWLTYAIDAYTRRIVGIYVSFDRPSSISIFMVLRDMVQRFSKLPLTIVADNGREFHSEDFEKFCASYRINIQWRPPHHSRFGSIVERVFRTTNESFIHNLRGNTKMTKNPRAMSASHNPKNFAHFTLADFQMSLEKWAFDQYDCAYHSTLGMSPREMYADAESKFGTMFGINIKYDQNFMMMTLANAGKRKVNSTRGITVNGVRYWNDCFRGHRVDGQKVEVKFDPFNIGVTYAFVDTQWVTCIADLYTHFSDRSILELRHAVTEIRQRLRLAGKRRQISESEIAAEIMKINNSTPTPTSITPLQNQTTNIQRLNPAGSSNTSGIDFSKVARKLKEMGEY